MDDRQNFVEAFKGYWSDPSVDALAELLTEDVILRQPLGATTRGLEAGKRAFARILAAIPDLRATVGRWGPTEDGVLIEFRLHGTVGGKPVEWPAVDRFVLRDGMASERVSYFDPGRLMRAVATRPTSWPRFLRSRSGR
jgi:ketosteroid isomerase-like protein